MFDLANFCRICTRAECKLIDIFSEDNDNIKFSDKLTYCVPEGLRPDDILPNMMCDCCCENLKISYSFKKICLKTRLALIACIQNSEKEKTKSDVFEEKCPQVQIKSEPISDDEYAHDSYDKLEELRVEDVFSDIIGVSPGKVSIKTEPLDYNPEDDSNMSKVCVNCNKIMLADENNDGDMCDECSVEDTLYTCTQCDEKFHDKDLLTEHENSHNETPSFVCSICNYSYTRESHLQAHMRAHTGEKPYSCDLCNESFAWNHHLQRHMKMHYKENWNFCTICHKQFGTVVDLQNHVKIHKNQTSPIDTEVKLTDDTHIDEVVEKIYSSASFKQGFGCPKCGKKFNKHSNMLKHLWFHTGSRSARTSASIVTCEVCQKKFKGKHKLQIHMRVHTGERPFSCTICHKNFTQSGYLSYHMRIHTGEKPFKCVVCGKCFTQKTTLSTHMRVHADKKPLNCPICNKHVSYNSTLRRHIKLMHNWVMQESSKMCE